jgi:hypothetical protein
MRLVPGSIFKVCPPRLQAQGRIFNCEVDPALHRTIEVPRWTGREEHDAAVVFKLVYRKKRRGKARGNSVE